MSRGSKPWRRVRQVGFAVLFLGAAVASAWLVRPSLASDFGIIPPGKPPIETPETHKVRIFKTPLLPTVHFTALKAEAVELWGDVQTTPDLIPVTVQTQIHHVMFKADKTINPYVMPFLTFVTPPLNRVWTYFIPEVPYCERYKCPVHCVDNDGDQDDKGCGKRPRLVQAVPEPRVWAMFGLGIATLGGLLRRRRSAAGAPVV